MIQPLVEAIKNMWLIRVGKDGNFYSRVMPDEYYLKKAKKGKLFDSL